MLYSLLTFVALLGLGGVFGAENGLPIGAVEVEEGALNFDQFENDTVLNLGDFNKYRDCDDVLKSGHYKEPGAYLVYVNSTVPLNVYCHFDVGVGRFVIMQQKYGRQSFVRPYSHYTVGFGSASSGDFWYGLSKMKFLTDTGNRVLTVTLQDWNNVIKVIRYNYFALGPASDRFRLNIGGYVTSHVLPDDFSHNNNMQFGTIDLPDIHGCATHMRGGWWYNYCTFALPTGHYYQGGPYHPTGGFYDGIFYNDWHGFGYSLKYIRMDLSSH